MDSNYMDMSDEALLALKEKVHTKLDAMLSTDGRNLLCQLLEVERELTLREEEPY